MQAALEYAREHAGAHTDALSALIRIPSVSTDPTLASEVGRCATWVSERCCALGMRTEIWPTAGHPAVFAELAGPEGSPTVLVYGHYDVQPAAPEDGWAHDPFDMQITDGQLRARGTTDDKGPVMAVLCAVESLARTVGSPLTIKLLIEGEEEIGSPNLPDLIEARADALRCDSVLISDTYWLTAETPLLLYGLRGLLYLFVRLDGPATDLHSGMHGGAVPNPHNTLLRIVSTFWDADGRVAVPGYWDGVTEPDETERAAYAALPLDIESYRAGVGAPALTSDDRAELLLNRWSRPTLDIHGVSGGYTGPGAKTIIPSHAELKLSCRLVPGQSPEAVTEAFRSHLAQVCPAASLSVGAAAPPVSLDRDSPFLDAAAAALEAAYGCTAVRAREGATIPAVAMLAEALGAPIVLLPIGWPDDNPHSHQEKLEHVQYTTGIQAFIHYFAGIAAI